MNEGSRHRVLLVRAWDQQTTGASCCGQLDGGGEFGDAADFAPIRADMTTMGAVYRALTAALPEVDVQVVDPRNTTWLVPALVRDAWRAQPRAGHVWKTIRRGTDPGAVVVDGRVVANGLRTDAETVTQIVRSALAVA
ncbi:MAG: hypothetical protein WD378_04700 [Egicoccus sp.]